MILIVDNYDSFTWNLVQRLGEIDATLNLNVVRNDKIQADEVLRIAPSHVIISPGPCTPREAGNSTDIISQVAGRIPLLGVCLGHQCIGAAFGMTVSRHPVPMHGKTSQVHHDGRGIFAGLPNPFTATRYHSLIVEPESVPRNGWAISAWTDEVDESGSTRRVVQGLRREWSPEDVARAPLEGVQFHPESFLTEVGPRLLANFIGAEGGAVSSRSATGNAGAQG